MLRRPLEPRVASTTTSTPSSAPPTSSGQDGANLNLDSAGTRRAVCAYIGACAAADTYYAVILRAKQWQAMAEAEQPLGLQHGVRPNGLIWPVIGPVVSPYGMRWGRMHDGNDIGAPTGTPILAAADGQVALREWFGGYGQFTCLRHAAAFATCYAHQSQTLVRLHELVKRGQRIRLVGCTGHCLGPRLHFEGTWREPGRRTSGTSTRSTCCRDRD
jgi:murein DD-endopeptidase MepM/ murein hydrolase activator NlpD